MKQSKKEKSEIQNPKAKKTRKKLVTQWINMPLINLNSKMKKYYERAFHCSSRLYQQGDKIYSRRCNSRTCMACNGVRTAAYLGFYAEQMLELLEPQFLTLTAKTVECPDADTLRHYIDAREYIWRKIFKNAHEQKGVINLKGIRAMEITVRPDGHYHIHFHFIIDGYQNAVWVKQQWLKHYPEALEYLQKIVPITSKGALLEVFKYGTKFMDKTKEKNGKGEWVEVYKKVPADRTDIVIQALYKKRLVSTFGGVRRMKDEDVNDMEVESQIDLDVADDIWDWYYDLENWLSKNTGEMYSDFVATKRFRKAFSS